MTLPERLREHLRRTDLPAGSRPVVAACSGGADSTALVRLLADTGLRDRLVVAHLDHGLRPDSGADALWVEGLAAELGLRYATERRPVVAAAGESPEAAARRVRFGFLADVAREHGAGHVAVAHHMDDQAETVLLRMLRGTGVRGLAAMRAARPLLPGSAVTLVRPLLPFRGREIRDWLAGRGFSWREDPTNRAGNDRARLRHEAFPVLEACAGRDPAPLLARLAASAADTADALDGAADVARAFVVPCGDGFTVARGIERLPAALRRAALAESVARLRDGAHSPTAAELSRLDALLAGEDSETVAGLCVTPQPDGWRLTAAPEEPRGTFDLPLAVPGSVQVPHRGVTLSARAGGVAVEDFLPRLRAAPGAAELVDLDRVTMPLRVRSPRARDLFHPLGAEGPSRLSHFLQRRGVAARDRKDVAVVVDAERIVWVPGFAPADAVRLTSRTTRTLFLERS